MVPKNFYVDQGATFTDKVFAKNADGTARNLTGYAVLGQCRKWYNSARSTYFTATITNAATGEVTISLTPDLTAILEPGRMVYDVIATLGSTVLRIGDGQLTIRPGLTGVTPPISNLVDDEENLFIERGATFSYSMELRNEDGSLKNLAGFTAVMYIRPSYDSPTIYMTLSLANTRITITGSTILLKLTPTETSSLTFSSAVFTVDITSPAAVVDRILFGNAVLK